MTVIPIDTKRKLGDELARERGRRNGSEPAKEKPRPGTAITFEPIEPWPDPVDGGQVANDVADALTRHVAMSAESAAAATLWTLFTHVFEPARISPILAITSPTKRCGKSTLLAVLARLVPKPLPSSNITAAAMFRAIEAFTPTLLVDEADSFMADRDELRGVVNSGHTADTAFVIRVVGEGANADVRRFATWCPKAFASIGRLAETIADRSIEIRLERKTAADPTERLEGGDGRYTDLARRLARWAVDHPDVATRRALVPAMHDRAADNWQPLIAIAEAIGGTWPAIARAAAVELTQSDDGDDAAAATMLLADLRSIFEQRDAEAIWTTELLDALTAMESRPWAEWRRGKPLSGAGLARQLAAFKVRPREIKQDGVNRNGYRRADLAPVWGRYLQASTPLLTASDAGLSGFQASTEPDPGRGSNPPDLALEAEGRQVEPRTPDSGDAA